MVITTILIVVLTLAVLMAIHEFGHFITAKKFGAKVEEFGIGLPPRIFGKKIGETIYSVNWLPIGAFVKILGEDKRTRDPRSFSQKSLYQRALIIVAGVVSFWIVSFVILTIVLPLSGVPTAIPDSLTEGFVQARLLITGVVDDSPADIAGVEAGDIIVSAYFIEDETEVTFFDKEAQFLSFVEQAAGQEIAMTVSRGDSSLEVFLTPLSDNVEGRGLIGAQVERVADIKTVWYKAPFEAFRIVGIQTIEMPRMTANVIVRLIKGEKVIGFKVAGIVGIGKMMGRSLGQGVGNFFSFVAMISIWLAIFNLLPIPALDGGRLLFLAIEGIRGKPVSEKIENSITMTFFILLIALMILITIKDIIGLF